MENLDNNADRVASAIPPGPSSPQKRRARSSSSSSSSSSSQSSSSSSSSCGGNPKRSRRNKKKGGKSKRRSKRKVRKLAKEAKDPLMKASLKKIPPTCTNLFNAEKFTAAVEKAGGVRKCFWPLKKAPKTFAALTNWIAQTLRQRGVRIIVFLDDFLIAHQDEIKLQTHVKILLDTLETLGWLINYKKSIITPSKSLVFLGIHWDPWMNRKRLTDEKIPGLVAKIDHLLWKERTTLRELQSLVGLLNFASFTVPKGRLNFRALLSLLNKILMSDHRILHNLPHAAIENLIWWRQNCQQSSAIHMPPPLHFLTTDASDIAWGARLDNLSLSGLWSEAEKDLHCNQKEMIAILRVLEDHCQLLKHKTVLIQSDNKSVVAYLRHEGGTKSAPLLDLTYKVFQITEEYQIHMNIFYIPAKEIIQNQNNIFQPIAAFSTIGCENSDWRIRTALWRLSDLINIGAITNQTSFPQC
ncbi:hypothetical protein PYW07_001751 [Mythimna separata]|uniref:Reverse transcriptase domain-containing protein n=1 Tax=Mythimna separata TaxID=271217 RepID=A0AAD7YSV3_MYTSE|nr:hypothetical protein PYW07_001751 [Mythimna separata]